MILTACGPTSIDKIKKDRLGFVALPDTVQRIYEAAAKRTKTEFKYAVSTDPAMSITHSYTGMDDGIRTLMTRGHTHHFYINDKEFDLSANQGDPFVLHDRHLYYTLELNLADDNYRQAVYMSTDLNEYLK